ncbi:MAG: CAP domain-containing protein [Sphingobacteriaceae bacterium]|nr:CAP domain-containing protein [Sphingobacteriaceae bacterium]
MKYVFLVASLLLSGIVQAQSFSELWYTELSVDSFFNTEAAKATIDVENPNIALLNAAIFFATNEARIKKKLESFKYDAILEKAAEFHSDEMRAKRFFNHINKTDKENRTPQQRIANKGGEFDATGENIIELPPYKTGPKGEYDVSKNTDGTFSFLALNGKPLKVLSYGDFARAAVKLWMQSPEHKANILNKNFSHLGCGVSIEEDPFKFKSLPMALATQNFGGYKE